MDVIGSPLQNFFVLDLYELGEISRVEMDDDRVLFLNLETAFFSM